MVLPDRHPDLAPDIGGAALRLLLRPGQRLPRPRPAQPVGQQLPVGGHIARPAHHRHCKPRPSLSGAVQ